MTDIALLASRYASRPLLLTSTAARDLAVRIRGLDARAFERPTRVQAFLRKVGFAKRGDARRAPLAMDDDYDGPPPVPMEEQLAYQPRWIGEVEDTGFCWSLKDGVALMCCDTPLVERGDEFCGMVWHGYDTLLMALREAKADARVKGVFLKMDTPGGVVGEGLPALAAFMRETSEAAGGKPVWIHAAMACSAGYWIAAQADRIIAPGVGYVGSLGAVMVHENWAGALEQDGIEITSIEFPEGGVKTDGAWWKSLSEAARVAWQSDVSQVGEMFLADVAAGRPQLTRDAMMAMRADAFMAEHSDPARSGLALQLVDEVATEEAAFAAFVAHLSAPPEKQPADAKGARASAPNKEASMAQTSRGGGQPAAQVAQAEKAFKLAQANLTTARAAAAEKDKADDDKDAAPDDADKGGEADDDTPAADDDKDDKDDEDETKTGAEAAVAISKSGEAKKHPALAHAAIASGQSLAQFKASVAALGDAPKVSRLDAAMAGARRLRPDAAGGKSSMGSAVSARIERNRGRSGEA